MKSKAMMCLILCCLWAGPAWASTHNVLGLIVEVQADKNGAPVLVMRRLWDSYGFEFEGTASIPMARAKHVTLNGVETPAAEAAKVGRTVRVTINRAIPMTFAFVDVPEADRAALRKPGGDFLVATGGRVIPGDRFPGILELTLALRDGALGEVVAIATSRSGGPLKILERTLVVADGRITGSLRLALPATEGKKGREGLPAGEVTVAVDLPVAGGDGTLTVEGQRPAKTSVAAYATPVPAKESAVWLRISAYRNQASLVLVDGVVVAERAHLLHYKGFVIKEGLKDVSGSLRDGAFTLAATVTDEKAGAGPVTITGHLIGDRLVGTLTRDGTTTPVFGGILPCSAVPGGVLRADH